MHPYLVCIIQKRFPDNETEIWGQVHGKAKILDTDLNYCQPPWVCIVPIDLFVKVSHLSQFFHSWLQSFSCPVTMHMWMLTNQLTILTISYAFSWFINKRNRKLWENQAFWILLLWHLVAEEKTDANSFIWSFPLYMYFFRNIDVEWFLCCYISIFIHVMSGWHIVR